MLNKLYFICIGLIAAFFFTQAQAGFYAPPPEDYAAPSNQRQLAYFTSLSISGHVDVTLITGSNQSQMTVTGDPDAMRMLKIHENDDALTIVVEDDPLGINEPIHIDISTQYLNNLCLTNYKGTFQATNFNTPYLNAQINSDGFVLLSGKIGLHDLSVAGSGDVQIHGVDSQSLNIRMKNNPQVALSGVANLEKLSAKGEGRLQLSWVDSDKLLIHQAGKTYITLAGIANFVGLELNDHAYFNGRYLRVKDGYIKTTDESVAYVQFLKAQSLLSMDASHINFYGQPPYRATFMANNGSILDMEDH